MDRIIPRRDIHPGRMCKCGHVYAYHVNPRTNMEDGCIFSYNCDCPGFEPDEDD